MTIGVHKPFDPQEYQYSEAAERKVLEYLKGSAMVKWVEQYPFGEKDIDIKVVMYQPNGEEFDLYIEVERRRSWEPRWDIWPSKLDPINIPMRKWPMIQKYQQDMEYWAVRDDLQRACIIEGDVIHGYRIAENQNRLVPENEYFLRVPRDQVLEYIDL